MLKSFQLIGMIIAIFMEQFKLNKIEKPVFENSNICCYDTISIIGFNFNSRSNNISI